MRKRDSATLALCPLLLRIALGLIFLFAGWGKLQPEKFTGEDAQRLIAMRIGQIVNGPAASPSETQSQPAAESPDDAQSSDDIESPAAPSESENVDDAADTPTGESAPATESTTDTPPPAEQPVINGNESPPTQQPAPPIEIETDAGDDTTISNKEQAPTEASTDSSADKPDEVVVVAMKLDHLTLMLDKAGHRWPHFFAWIAVITEALGGAMVLIGLLSRFWATGLLIAMVYAAVLTSIPQWTSLVDPNAPNQVIGYFNALQSDKFTQLIALFLQFTLFIAAACIVIGGPGTISIDRFLWGARSSE